MNERIAMRVRVALASLCLLLLGGCFSNCVTDIIDPLFGGPKPSSTTGLLVESEVESEVSDAGPPLGDAAVPETTE